MGACEEEVRVGLEGGGMCVSERAGRVGVRGMGVYDSAHVAVQKERDEGK